MEETTFKNTKRPDEPGSTRKYGSHSPLGILRECHSIYSLIPKKDQRRTRGSEKEVSPYVTCPALGIPPCEERKTQSQMSLWVVLTLRKGRLAPGRLGQ